MNNSNNIDKPKDIIRCQSCEAEVDSKDNFCRKCGAKLKNTTVLLRDNSVHRGLLPAYVISEVEVLDEVQGQLYRDLAAASIAVYGGRYLARGIRPEVPEGTWPESAKVVLVEFPDMQRLQEWYSSSEYAEALAIRRVALNRRLLFVGLNNNR